MSVNLKQTHLPTSLLGAGHHGNAKNMSDKDVLGTVGCMAVETDMYATFDGSRQVLR